MSQTGVAPPSAGPRGGVSARKVDSLERAEKPKRVGTAKRGPKKATKKETIEQAVIAEVTQDTSGEGDAVKVECNEDPDVELLDGVPEHGKSTNHSRRLSSSQASGPDERAPSNAFDHTLWYADINNMGLEDYIVERSRRQGVDFIDDSGSPGSPIQSQLNDELA